MPMKRSRISGLGHALRAMFTPAVAEPIRHGYQIIALCNESHTGVVQGAMRDEFETSRIQVESIGAEPHSCRALALVCAHVRCSNVERSSLVRLVHRLGLMPAVRSVRWESIPGAATSVAGNRPPSAKHLA